MAKYLIYLVLALPMIGILVMEQGVISLTSYEVGYPNGASFMYFLYASTVLGVFYLVQKTSLFSLNLRQKNLNNYYTQRASLIALLFNLAICFIILFGFGSINVLLGNIGKGDFRVSLGGLGFVAMGISRWTAPALLALSTFIYVKSDTKSYKKRLLLFIHYLVCGFMAASWGFKSFAITIMIPALIVLYWDISFYRLLLAGCFAGLAFVFFSIIFDGNSLNFQGVLGENELFDQLNKRNALTMVLYRATVLQGDVSWIMWERYTHGVEFPVYYWNLLSAFGNNLSSLFLTPDQITEFNYSNQLTAIAAQRPVGGLDGSYNVTGTVFSEGLLAGGIRGLAFFSILAGLISGGVYKLIKIALVRNQVVIVCIGAAFFFKIFNWLNGGNLVTLFHFSNIVFVGLTVFLLLLIMGVSVKPRVKTLM